MVSDEAAVGQDSRIAFRPDKSELQFRLTAANDMLLLHFALGG